MPRLKPALICLVLIGASMSAAPADPLPLTPKPLPRAVCGPGDLAETGLQGEVPVADQDSGRSKLGYTCNMRLVGHNDILGKGSYAQLTWYGDCAYVLTNPNDAIGVIDASDPTQPRLVQIMPLDVEKTHEGMHANAARGILIVPGGNIAPQIGTAKFAIYDIAADCTRPRLLTVYDSGILGPGVHAGAFSADGMTYYATFATAGPCIAVIGLDDLSHPTTIGTYGATYHCHDLDLSRDGTRAYIGSYGTIAEAVATLNPLPTDNLGTSANPTGPRGLEIVDTSEIQSRKTNPKIRRIGVLNSGRPHSQLVTQIRGRRFVFGSNEGSCASGGARAVDVTEEQHPTIAAELALEYNVSPKCPLEWARVNSGSDPLDTGVRSNAIFMYWSHMFGTDSAEDTSDAGEPLDPQILFMTAFGSGLRAIDISDPVHPRELGYYNPPVPASTNATVDVSLTWIRYRPESGQIWFGSKLAGFNIVEFTNGVGRRQSAPQKGSSCRKG
jgi:hypothetical protein